MIETYLVYNSALLFSVVFAYIAERSANVRTEKIARILSAIVLILPVALRDFKVGTDTIAYISVFQTGSNLLEHFEWGFLNLCNFLKILGLGERSILWMMGICTFLPVCMKLPKRFLSISIYFYVVTFYLIVLSGSRQTMSLSFVFLAIVSLQSERYPKLKYCIFILIAFSIHSSAIIYFPFLFVYKFTLSPKVYVVVLVILLYVISSYDIIGMIWEASWFLDSSYSNYAVSQYNRETEIGSGYGVIIRCLIPCLFLLLSKRIYQCFEITPLMGTLCIAYLCSYFLALQIHIFGRLVSAFSLVQFMLVGYIMQTVPRSFRKIFWLMLIILYFLVYERDIAIALRSLGAGLGVSPYQFCF